MVSKKTTSVRKPAIPVIDRSRRHRDSDYDFSLADEISHGKPKHDLKPATVATSLAPTNPKTFRPLNERELGKLCAEYARIKPNGKRSIPEDHPLLLDHYNVGGERLDRRLPLRDARISYETMQGGFSVCCIVLTRKIAGPYSERLKKYVAASETLIWRGASRRSYRDRHNQIKAEMLAFERAILCSRAERVPV